MSAASFILLNTQKSQPNLKKAFKLLKINALKAWLIHLKGVSCR